MWWCRSTREMNRGFVCFLVLGLGSAALAADPAPDSVGSETKTISAKISSPTVSHSPLDKSKRGAVKLSNPENSAFNHLGSANAAGGTNAYKQASGVAANTPPFKYLYNNQYYQPNPYLTYVQVPQAAQIAAQYAFQSNPVAHYLQTPTQIQYVSTPTVAQVPPVKYQSFSNEQYSTAGADAGASSGAAAASSHYAAPGQQVLASTHSYSPAASQASAASASQTKQQVQVPLYSGYQTQQQFYYPQQQPFFTFVPQPHISPANFIYQQPNANYYFKQQQPQYLNFYGGNRFGFYSPNAHNSQFTYLVPMPVAPAVQEQSTTTSDLKTADKALSAGQHSASANSYAYGTKA